MALAIACLAMIYACKRTEALNPIEAKNHQKLLNAAVEESGPVEVNSGWLKFTSLEGFNKVMTDLHDRFENAQGMDQWESNYSDRGFTSLRKQYEIIDADTSEYRTAPTVDSLIKTNQLLDCPDSYFATVLNKDGFIQIADTIYTFKPGKAKGEAYAVPDRYASDLLKGAEPSSLTGSKMHLTSFLAILFPRWEDTGDVQPGPGKNPICYYPSGRMLNWWGQIGNDIYSGDNGSTFPQHNGCQVKLNYHRWRVGYIFYASAGIRLKMWKHTRLAGWLSVTNATEMIMESCCKGNVFIPGLPLFPFNEQTSPAWPHFARYETNVFEKTMKWVATGNNEIILDHFNFHFKVNYSNRIVERDIRQ